MSNTFRGTGVESIIKCLVPQFSGWVETKADQRYIMGFPLRCFWHEGGIFVMSAVETMGAEEDKGPEYHLSMSRPHPTGPRRITSAEAQWVLKQFKLEGAEEDNHVVNGKVRNFWRPAALPLVGMECPCKKEEQAIVEDKGDFVWRPLEETR